MSFANLDMTSYTSTELSGKRRSAGGTSLPDRMEATMRVIMYMANIATDENARMGRKVLCRGDMRWGQQFHRVKDGIGHVYVINENVEKLAGLRGDFLLHPKSGTSSLFQSASRSKF